MLLCVPENDWSKSFRFHLSSSFVMFNIFLQIAQYSSDSLRHRRNQSGWVGLSTKNSGAPHSGHLKLSSMSWQFAKVRLRWMHSPTNLQYTHPKKTCKNSSMLWWCVMKGVLPFGSRTIAALTKKRIVLIPTCSHHDVVKSCCAKTGPL